MPKTRAQAIADLERYQATMWSIVKDGVTDYVTDYAALRRRHSLRSQSSIINDLMVERAKQHFASQLGVRFIRRGNGFQILLGQDYVIKLKKLNKKLQASNIMTQAVFAFITQDAASGSAQLHLKGMPPLPTNLHLGYQLKGVELTNPNIWVVCPDGMKVGWEWELKNTGAEVVPLNTRKQAEPRKKRTFSAKTPPKPAKDDDSAAK
jgi:hypothetical protein